MSEPINLSVIPGFEQITIFEKASGSKLNLNKTEGMYMCLQAGKGHGPIPIMWKTESIRVLGTNHAPNQQPSHTPHPIS